MELKFKDLTGKNIEHGHIVAVRYGWNSYVGEIISNGVVGGLYATGAKRHAFFSPHSIEQKNATYQILGHKNPNHPDFNQSVLDWYNSEDLPCDVELKIYQYEGQTPRPENYGRD